MGIDYLVFGNVDSRDYNIEVFFKDVDRTPKRVYEVREVPGRNGAIYIDQKRYEDVPVTYDCVALDDADRKEFVNALAALLGYNRLEDSFNDDEFYNAVFDDDVDPHVTADRSQSTFTLHFTRSAQRYLKEGETAVSVDDGDTLTNPTLFEAHPLLEVEGYGDINLNGYGIKVANTLLGNIQLKEKFKSTSPTASYTFDSSLVNAGDEFTISGYPYSSPPEISVYVHAGFRLAKNASAYNFSNSGDANTSYVQCMEAGDGKNWYASGLYELYPITFIVGAAADYTATFQSSFTTKKGTQTGSASVASTTVVEYDGNNKIDITVTRSIVTDTLNVLSLVDNDYFIVCTTIADSSVSTLGHPTYIDCEIGEAYKEEGNSIVSLNRSVSLGSRLPELSPGDNEITFDNTITDLKVVPNWWEV